MSQPLKIQSTVDRLHQTDAGDTFVTGRDYRALLRSDGHLFRDGRWLDSDDPFHVYREIENPGLGMTRTYQAPEVVRGLVESENNILGPQSTFHWRPALTRAFSDNFWYGATNVALNEPIVPSYDDKKLELNALGSSYIRKFRPGNPFGTLGLLIGELHQIPRIPILALKHRSARFRDIGSEYLNIEFGWKPFLKDLVNLYESQRVMSSALRKLVINNGISIKRRSKRDEDTISSDWENGYIPYPFTWMGDGSSGGSSTLEEFYSLGPFNAGADSDMTGFVSWKTRTQTITESWFVGTFKYYVPDIGSDRWTEKAKSALFGVNATPSLIYELMPWSWLIDWFANVGDIMSNVSSNAVDNETLDNAHVMQTVTDRFDVHAHVAWDYYERTFAGTPVFSVAPGSDDLHFSSIWKSKYRQKASPFGFGLKTADFTLRQKAILAALATSRKLPSIRRIGYLASNLKRDVWR